MRSAKFYFQNVLERSRNILIIFLHYTIWVQMITQWPPALGCERFSLILWAKLCFLLIWDFGRPPGGRPAGILLQPLGFPGSLRAVAVDCTLMYPSRLVDCPSLEEIEINPTSAWLEFLTLFRRLVNRLILFKNVPLLAFSSPRSRNLPSSCKSSSFAFLIFSGGMSDPEHAFVAEDDSPQ